MSYEVVIGLEVHCELATMTKLFCGCPNEFGSEPNTNVCPVCLGLPGSLPVLNQQTVEFALRFGVALGFDAPERSVFARKNYFYPDMPKDYQVSQYEEPIVKDGVLDVEGTPIRIERAHLEEDTGKTTHVGGGGRIHEADHSLVDYNRAGVPLMEIVSRPDLRSAEQARAYVAELRAVLATLGVSDVKMEEGSLRVDANVSLRPEGTEELGTKVEVKNMNSLRSLARAIDHEIERQAELLDAGERIHQETRHWDEADGRTHGMRSKEEANDYRYFPEPDLVPVAPDGAMRDRAAASVTELPAAQRARLVAQWNITEADAQVLLKEDLVDFVERAARALDKAMPKDVVHLATNDVVAYINEFRIPVADLKLRPEGLAELADLQSSGAISRNQARDVLGECLRDGKRPSAVVADRGMEQVSDESELGAVIDGILAANADEVAAYRDGDDKAQKKKRGFFMGEAMKALKGQGNPQVLNRLLDEKLSG